MPLPGAHGRASAEQRTERGRGEPPTLHDPHTPVWSVKHAHTRHVDSRAYETAGCRHCTPYTQCSSRL
eukprot:455370-Prymnesium_polylepis.1